MRGEEYRAPQLRHQGALLLRYFVQPGVRTVRDVPDAVGDESARERPRRLDQKLGEVEVRAALEIRAVQQLRRRLHHMLVRLLLPDASNRDGPHTNGRLGLDLQLSVHQPLHRQKPRPSKLQHRGDGLQRLHAHVLLLPVLRHPDAERDSASRKHNGHPRVQRHGALTCHRGGARSADANVRAKPGANPVSWTDAGPRTLCAERASKIYILQHLITRFTRVTPRAWQACRKAGAAGDAEPSPGLSRVSVVRCDIPRVFCKQGLGAGGQKKAVCACALARLEMFSAERRSTAGRRPMSPSRWGRDWGGSGILHDHGNSLEYVPLPSTPLARYRS